MRANATALHASDSDWGWIIAGRTSPIVGSQFVLARGLDFSCAASLTFVRGISVGEEVPLPRPRIQLVHGTVPQKCARNTLPARSGILYRPAIEGLRCHPLPTSSMRAPEVTPN